MDDAFKGEIRHRQPIFIPFPSQNRKIRFHRRCIGKDGGNSSTKVTQYQGGRRGSTGVSGGRRGSTGVNRWRHCSVGCCAFNKDVGLGQGQEHGVSTRCIRFEARELWRGLWIYIK